MLVTTGTAPISNSSPQDTMPNNRTLENTLRRFLAAFTENQELPPEEKLVHNLLMTAYRHHCSINWLITSRSTGRIRPHTRALLTWALVEILWMTGVPGEAVTNAAVDFTKNRTSKNEAAYVNAFLRRLLEDYHTQGLQGLLKKAPPNVQCEIPDFLWNRWVKQRGLEETRRIAAVLQLPARTILRLRAWPPRETMMPDGVQPLPAPEWAPWARLFTPQEASRLSLDSLMQGDSPFYIQDPATLLAPTLLAPRPGEQVADLCAAPGGKALILGEMLEGRGNLFCSDRAESKLPRLRENLATLPNVEFRALDASTHVWEEPCFDAVLLDVPCSNSGVIRRKPDVRLALTPRRLQEVLELQRMILEKASAAVRPGGRLVYSTCSIEPDENQEQIRSFLQKHPDYSLATDQTILPTEEHDGAYAALLIRREN